MGIHYSYLEVKLQLFWRCIRVILELCLSYFGVMLKLFSNCFEFILVTLELYSSHSSVHLVLVWSYLDLISTPVGVVLG